MDYEKLHRDTITKLQEMVNSGKITAEIARGICADFVTESEDERIRTFLHHTFTAQYLCKDKLGKWHGEPVANILAWLEKQDEKDKFIKKELGCIKVYRENAIKRLEELEKQGEQNHCMIQWKGDNLKEVIDFTGKDKNFEKWFKSFEEYEKYVQEHDGIFKLFNADGSHYEVPVGAWIVKTPDGYNVASKAVFKQKSDDRVEKFKVGEWVVNKFGGLWHIDSFDKKNYQVSDGEGNNNYFSIDYQDEMHHWTIADAKDGDVLAISWWEDNDFWEKIVIFKKYHNKGVKGLYSMPCVEGYGNTFKNGKVVDENVPYYSKTWTCNLHLATKEQRNLLFQKMHEAGYEWDADKKELKKIEQKPAAWSENDEKYIYGIIPKKAHVF